MVPSHRGTEIVFEQTFKNIDDVLWKEAGCATELDYTEQTSWILFLKYLDDLERANEQKAELQGKKYAYILDKPHRWSVWAAPKKRDGSFDHDKALTGDSPSVGIGTQMSDRPRRGAPFRPMSARSFATEMASSCRVRFNPDATELRTSREVRFVPNNGSGAAY
jgi:HsdM N-terminal domain